MKLCKYQTRVKVTNTLAYFGVDIIMGATTLSITKLSIMTFSTTTLSIITFSIIVNKMRHSV